MKAGRHFSHAKTLRGQGKVRYLLTKASKEFDFDYTYINVEDEKNCFESKICFLKEKLRKI